MHYKYKKVITTGANGTTLVHKQTEENPIMTLGEIDEYIYIYTLELGEQHEELEFAEVTLTDDELEALKSQRFIQQSKKGARAKIRHIKDLEDDLVDQKQLIQFMARGFAGLWLSLPDEIKDNNPYRDNFNQFSQVIVDANLRLDLEENQGTKIAKIIADESRFADIVKEEYLSKLNE